MPTATPESDGTLEWDATTLVYVEVHGGGQTGDRLYLRRRGHCETYRNASLAATVVGEDAMAIGARWNDMYAKARNLGRDGITSMAVSAVDVALWDLKGKLSGSARVYACSARRARACRFMAAADSRPIPTRQLCDQLAGWVSDGIARVKMKVGRDPKADPRARRGGPQRHRRAAELFVDANGAYSVQQAVAQAQHFAEQRVTWFEEPVFREDYAGTRSVREHAPARHGDIRRRIRLWALSPSRG